MEPIVGSVLFGEAASSFSQSVRPSDDISKYDGVISFRSLSSSTLASFPAQNNHCTGTIDVCAILRQTHLETKPTNKCDVEPKLNTEVNIL